MTQTGDFELITNTNESDKKSSERRRVPRLFLTCEQFRLNETGKVYSVVDLSEDGLALRVLSKDDLVLFSIGRTLSGTLNLNGAKYILQMDVRSVRSDLVGCKFKEIENSAKRAIVSFLDPASIGKALKAIPSNSNVLWFSAPPATDLMIELGNDSDFMRFSLYVFGNLIQWDAERGLVTGRTSPSEQASEIRGAVRFETLLFESDEKVDETKLKLAIKVILNSKIEKNMKTWILSRIELITDNNNVGD